MKLQHVIIALLCFSPSIFYANISDLNTILAEIATKVETVKDKKYTYEQSLKWDESRPFSITFESVREGAKGNPLSETYQFNLADFDIRAVRYEDKKDKIIVTLTADNRLKSIKYNKEGEIQGYVNQVSIIAQDIDNAKALEKLFEEAIPPAKSLFSSEIQLNSFQERKEWLTKNIQDFSIEDEVYKQSFSVSSDHPTLATYTHDSEKKNEEWQFNLADLRKQTVELQIKGKSVFVSMKTKNSNKYIKYVNEETLKGYNSDLRIYLSEIDNARHLVNILKELIPEAEAAMKMYAPKPDSPEAALKLLSELTGKVVENENEYLQELSANCLTTLKTVGTEKGKSVDEAITVHFADINDKKLELAIKGTSLLLTANTRYKKSLVQVKKDGELENYSDDFVLRAPDIETAKSMLIAMEIAAEGCKEKIAYQVPEGGAAAQFDWLSTNLGEVKAGSKEYQQSLKKIDGEACKWEFTLMTYNGKGSEEEIFIVNLYDLDADKLDFEISRQELGVLVKTNKAEKIIKHFKNGEPDDYENEFLLRANSVEDARNIIESLKRGIAECE